MEVSLRESSEREKYYQAALIVWGLFFTCLYMLLSRATAPPDGFRIFNSPDETANYYFTKQWVEHNRLTIDVPLNTEFANTLYPRATTVLPNGQIAPGSFVGIIILYGLVAKFFGSWIIPYITPLVSYLGMLYFYRYLKKIFSSEVAFGAALLLMLFPAWAYYNSRSMFHNVLFVNLMIICFYFLHQFFATKKTLQFCLATLFLFLALFTRTVEALWLVPVFLLMLVLGSNFRGMWKARLLGVMAISMGLGLIALVQWLVFASPVVGAYTALRAEWNMAGLAKLFFPFGFHLSYIGKHALTYGLGFFWWYSVAAIVGLFLLLRRLSTLTHEQRLYIALHLTLSWVLVVYYGSWVVSDSTRSGVMTLDSSYLRYWLPSFVLAMPYVAYGLIWVIRSFPGHSQRRVVGVMVAVIFASLSWWVTFYGSPESLTGVRESIYGYYAERDLVQQYVDEPAVIMTERSDKIFFPGRAVMIEPTRPEKIKAIAGLVGAGYPVYWYTHVTAQDAERYQTLLEPAGLRLGARQKIYANESLYAIIAATIPD